MPRSNIDRLLSPRSIAVIGASDKPGRIGTWVFENIVRDFPGPVHPVNPRGGHLGGLAVHQSVDTLPDGIDMAVVMVPAEAAAATIEQCASRGIGGITLLSSGFSEAGESGTANQEALDDVISRTGVALLGPNCIGYLNMHEGIRANFSVTADVELPPAGPVALISQSGGFGSYILTKSLLSGLKLGWFASTGNEAGVNLAGVLEHVIEREDVNTVLMFSETLRDPETFIRAATRANELDKPIVLLKAGRSEEAARAAMSHTASIVGSADVLDAVCEQYGVIVVHSMEEMLDLGLMFQDGRRMTGRRVGIMTTSGGAGVLLSDAAAAQRLAVPEVNPHDARRLEEQMPQPFYGSVANPIDTTAQLGARPEAFQNVLTTLTEVKDFDALAIVTWAGESPSNDALLKTYQNGSAPLAVLSTAYMKEFQAAGVPTFLDPSRLMRALGALADYSTRPALEPATAAAVSVPAEITSLVEASIPEGLLLESDAKRVLAHFGAPVTEERMARTALELQDAASSFEGPVAIKVMSYDLPHKSDVGGVRLGLEPSTVESAWGEMQDVVKARAPIARIEGVLVQEMVPARLEMTCGMRRDPVFGPVVAVGLGGVTIEIMATAALLHTPFTLETARRRIGGLLEGRITSAARGLTPEELDALASLAVAVSQVAETFPVVSEIDINPVRVHEGRAVAADALIVLDGGEG